MQNVINELSAKVEQSLAAVNSSETLSAFWQEYLSKNGKVTGLMKELRNVPAAERPAAGKIINEFKQQVQAKYDEAAQKVSRAEMDARNAAETVDITMPAKIRPQGALHPITLVKNQIIDAFAGMGFQVFDAPEIDDDDHNFTRLNVPKDHPARDMQDTFYLTEDLLLRTQTSNGQIRTMDRVKPPIKVLIPGRVFRSDSDATHSPMFHQMEGLVVDKGITLCDLQGMLDKLVQALFGEGTRTRLRPSYFPFTEPSAEMDLWFPQKKGGAGWIEWGGCGMVNPNVLTACGIDPEVYTGFAFGMGLERTLMLRHGIADMHDIVEGDIRFSQQFGTTGKGN